MPVLNIFQSSGTLDSLHPICSEYIISHQIRVALPLKCFQNLTLSSVSPLPLMPTSPPWRSLLSPALSFSWLVTLTQTRQMGQQGSGFPGPKALAAPRSAEKGQRRKALKTPLPVVQATSSPWTRTRGLSRAASVQRRWSFTHPGVKREMCWEGPSGVLHLKHGRTTPSRSRSQRWAVRLCPTQIWERKVQEKSLGILCVCVFVCVCVCVCV